MTGFELLSAALAVIALAVAGATAIYTRAQATRATEALAFQQQTARGDAVMHFTDRFFELVKTGEPITQVGNPDGAYQYWSLHATEFYFFHHELLPPFMYSLWMIDLAELYSGSDGSKARESHVTYLRHYSFHYREMALFYDELYKLARDHTDSAIRNEKVANFVTSWIAQNRRRALS